MSVQVLKIETTGFDSDAGCNVQTIVATDGDVTVTVTGCVWEGPEGEDLDYWFEEAVQFANDGFDGYSLS